MKYDLSVILPSINPNHWSAIFAQLANTIKNHSWELICVGPSFPPQELEKFYNFFYIRDFGCPSRSFQIGSTIANGKYLCFIPDDIIIDEGGFDQAIDLLESKTEKDGVCLRYSEGPNYTGAQHDWIEYWTAGTHDSLKLKNIKPEWKTAPCFMYNTDYFRKLGGLDCRFEHVNMNCSKLAFNIQRLGGEMLLSTTRVFRANWQPWSNNEETKSPIQKAYEQNDNPLFQKMFNEQEITENFWDLDYNNWREQSTYWPRRYKLNGQ